MTAIVACTAAAEMLPDSMPELPMSLRERLGGGDTAQWYCLDVAQTEELQVVSIEGHDLFVRLFDARRQRELSADIVTTDRAAQFALQRGHYALSIWSAGRDARYEVLRNVVLPKVADGGERREPASAEKRATPAAGPTRLVELMRGAAGYVGGPDGDAEYRYGLTIPDGYDSRATSHSTGAASIDVQDGRGHTTALAAHGTTILPSGRYLVRVRGSAAAEARYELMVDMILKKLELDRASARPLQPNRPELIVVGGDEPRAVLRAFAVSGDSRVQLRASRVGGAAILTLTDASGAYIDTMSLNATPAEMSTRLKPGHYFIRVESDDGATANIELRVIRFDRDAGFEKKPRH